MRRLMVFLALGALAAAGTAPAQTNQPPLSVERIYGKDALRLESLSASKWLEEGAAYTVIEPSASVEGGSDIVRYDTATGEHSVLVDARDLVPEGGTAAIAIDDYQWSPDRRFLLIATNTKRFRRTNAFGDYWLLDLETRALRRIGARFPASTLMYAEFSPDSRRIAYVQANNLYVEPVAGGEPRAITRDGTDRIVNGVGDWVYEEEFGLAKAFSWSPDSRRIAYWRFDTEGVGTFYMMKNTGGQYSQPIPLQYPKAGTTNSAVRVGTVEVASGRTTWFDLKGDPRQNYVPRMSWADRSDTVIIQHMNRLQNSDHVLIGDVADGSVRTLFTERGKAWVEVNEDPVWLNGGEAFTWLSERDGWRHLYVVSRDGTRFDLRTPGAFDVVSVEAVDRRAGQVYFLASPEDPTERYLYRATLAGTPKVERVTPAGAEGTHRYRIAPGAGWAFHTRSSFDDPPVTDIVNLPAHRSARTLVRNDAMRTVARGTGTLSEFFRVDIGEVALDGWMIKPPGFDPQKRYPILIYVYGEPWGQTVADSWGGSQGLWHRMLAQQGYLVASIDPRGTASPRGRDWRKSIYRQIGILASADLAAAVRRMIETRPYIDADRVGVWGWSGGGAMTLNAMFRYPELYSTGIAVAGPVDQTLYDTIYQERYMGLPKDNVEGYRDGSPITFAQNLKGDLLVIHGTLDDNVHYQNLEQLAAKLIAENKQFSMMAYPDQAHGISDGPNTRLHLFTLMTNYLHTHLPPGGR